MPSRSDLINIVGEKAGWHPLSDDAHIALFGGTAEGYSEAATETWWNGITLPDRPTWAAALVLWERFTLTNDPAHPRAIYQDALSWVGETAEYSLDLAKARDIHRNVLRRERAAAWPEADAAWFMAMDSGDTDAVNAAATVRQRMRDAPANASIGAAGTFAVLVQISLVSILAAAEDS